MTKAVAPSLDEVLDSKNPAWLWDGERLRVVWANAAGVDWFGAETLFDVLDMVFDASEPSIAEIKAISNNLQRGESQNARLDFAASAQETAADCTCYVHALADGRAGLLVVAGQTNTKTETLSPAIQQLALSAFPLPIFVLSGTDALLFANQSARDAIGRNFKFDFAKQLVQRAHNNGLVSSQLNIQTVHGKRDMRIIVRPLEQSDRLADSTFLIVLEDITDRRALQRTLLDAASQEVAQESTTPPTENTQSDDTNTQSDAPLKQGDVAQTLSHLRTEIESQTRSTETTASTNDRTETPAKKPDGEFQVPAIVSDTLNKLPQPLVIINQQGKLLFANNVAVDLMEVDTWQEIDNVTSLIDALNALEGEDGDVSVFTANDDPINLDAIVSVFPWKDGPVSQYTLSIANDGEGADNRRKLDGDHPQKKKMKKLR